MSKTERICTTNTSNDNLVAFPEVTKLTKEAVDVIKSLFPNYIETYDNWVRLEFICIPIYMIGFDWKPQLKELGIDALKQEFIRRGYSFKRRVQTFDYKINGQTKKIKVIMWITDKKIY